ncbi:hypothetical protein F511_38107 [Dorcoceras hygrometricum]|uniref:Uncharacterized protein n=1 Tax=Dorcoceras hygrometricum TaxID=472368 RepID=A0A2Z7DBS2_9LAMI|nr:hypothetical protein F511_38107 [Dorcoceras hygrometricum]
MASFIVKAWKIPEWSVCSEAWRNQGFEGSVFEEALNQFFANASVIAGMIVSTVVNKKIVITPAVFTETFHLPTEGLDYDEATMMDLKPMFTWACARPMPNNLVSAHEKYINMGPEEILLTKYSFGVLVHSHEGIGKPVVDRIRSNQRSAISIGEIVGARRLFARQVVRKGSDLTRTPMAEGPKVPLEDFDYTSELRKATTQSLTSSFLDKICCIWFGVLIHSLFCFAHLSYAAPVLGGFLWDYRQPLAGLSRQPCATCAGLAAAHGQACHVHPCAPVQNSMAHATGPCAVPVRRLYCPRTPLTRQPKNFEFLSPGRSV